MKASMELKSEIIELLDNVAPELAPDADWTVIVHNRLAELAVKYATACGGSVGWESEVPGQEGTTLEVYRTGGKPGQFLFDQCWLRFHHTNGSEEIVFVETSEPKHGYLIECVLAIETEWHGLSHDGKRSVPFYQDFCKLVVVKATTKLFVFRCSQTMLYEETMERLRSQLISIERKDQGEAYLISCFRTDLDRFIHSIFDAWGNRR
jgi:hypothetical protein